MTSQQSPAVPRKPSGEDVAHLPAKTDGARQVSAPLSIPDWIPGRRSGARRLNLKMFSFVVIVALPTLLAALYYYGMAANQYVSESRFGVRTGEMYRSETSGGAQGAGNILAAGIDSHVIVQYIQSAEIVNELQKRLNILQMFSKNEADYFSKAGDRAAIEDLTAYWRGKVDAFFDATTGTISLRIRAFDAPDALKISEEVLKLSENLVNDLSTRARGDSLRIAEAEVQNAEGRLQSARAALLTLRNDEGILDPKNESQAQLKIISSIREQLIRARGEMNDMLNYLDADAVQIRTIRSRIRSYEEQLALAEAQRTSPSGASRETMSAAMAKFERLDTERMFAERNYNLVLEDLQKARVNASRQLVYLATFVRPTMASRALYPKRTQNVVIVLICAFFAWVLALVMVQSVREHI